MADEEAFTFAEMRVILTAFAMWMLLQDERSCEPVELVDRFIKETT